MRQTRAAPRCWTRSAGIGLNFGRILLIPVPICRQGRVWDLTVPTGGLGGVIVRPSVPAIGVFDDATIRAIGWAFDAACEELRDAGQPDVVQEVMVKRIIAAARRGERNATQLRDAALIGLRDPKNETVDGDEAARKKA